VALVVFALVDLDLLLLFEMTDFFVESLGGVGFFFLFLDDGALITI
jgi:hypothetical protein